LFLVRRESQFVITRRVLSEKVHKLVGGTMKTTRRNLLHLCATAAAFQAFSCSANAQDWPTRPVTMVVPYAAGSAADVLGRILAPHLSDFLGQQVIVEDIGGAGGMTGAARVAKATPDGYQFVVGGTGTFAANQTLYKKPLYNAATDFAPVVLIDEQPIVLVARKDFPASNLPEFMAYAKANDAKLQYGSAGVGSGSHLACVVFNATAGINVAHISYRAAILAIEDLIAGRIDYSCPLISAAYPPLESNGIKAIAIFARNRSPILPNLASADEQGMAHFEVYYWDAFFFPKGTASPIVEKLHDATVAAMDIPSVRERLKSLGLSVVAPERRAPEYLQSYVESEIEKWARAIKASGAILD
jgi:tripartite-type tricarboxylate transporter receptor subunit TctC